MTTPRQRPEWYARLLALTLSAALLFCGCGSSGSNSGAASAKSSAGNETAAPAKGSRDNTPVVYTPLADGLTTYGNEAVTIDASHTEEGYVMVNYTGNVHPSKLRITMPDETVYTYDLNGGYEAFPLTDGSGTYQLTVYENVSGNQYSTCFSQRIDAEITNEFGPYLYSSQYVNFTADSLAVSEGRTLAEPASSDLDVVSNVYEYIKDTITYDTDKAKNVQSGYLPDIDEIMTSHTGICFDYAAVMAAMLRSQNIPTRLEIGYAGTVYHAWISVHIADLGWVNGIIEFDGQEWKLMDPTFAANSATSDLKKFIGDGSNYQVKYLY